MQSATVIIGLQHGDEGKGKVTAALAEKHDVCLRYGGGPNAGHTIYVDDRKVVTHAIPSGIAYGQPVLIGAGCVLHPRMFFAEMQELQDLLPEIDIRPLIHIDRRVHIITDEHIEEDKAGDKVGSTKRGIMPVYRDKYARKGIRAESIPELEPFLVDGWRWLKMHRTVLCEGAQGFRLDVDYGDYPYVSSPCLPGSVNYSGVPGWAIHEVVGVAKAYETYVGTKEFEPGFNYTNGDAEWLTDTDFDNLREVGQEYGATTGRARQVNYLNLNELREAVYICGCSTLIINKCDIIQDADIYKYILDGEVHEVDGIDEWISAVEEAIWEEEESVEIIFSASPEGI